MSDDVTKKELVEALAASTGEPKSKVDRLIDALCEKIVADVRGGRRVQIRGFGTFQPVTRAARKGRNLATGQPIDVPESKSMRFVISSSLKGF